MKDYLNLLKSELVKHNKKISFVLVPSNKIPKIESDFISPEIMKEIKNHKKVIKIKLPKIKITILYKKKFPKKQIENIINRFHTILSLFDFYRLPYSKNIFSLILIPTNMKKELPRHNTKLNHHNVNSGSSYIFKNEICIWREEEIEKVFLHELFHCLGFDRFAILNKYDIPQFKISDHQNFNEGYNELSACLYNCCFQSIETKKDINKIFNQNKLHSLHQMKQLLQHHNFTSLNDLKYQIFPQDASVFSYYILKGMYLFNLKDLLTSCPNQLYLFPLKGHLEDMKRFNEKICNDEKLNGLLIHLIKNNKYKKNYSMKMTI